MNLVRKLSIQYFNKIKLNYFAKENAFILFISFHRRTFNSQRTDVVID